MQKMYLEYCLVSRFEVVSTFEGWQPCFLLKDGHRVRLQNIVYIIWLTDYGQSVNILILLFLFNLSLPNMKYFIVLVIWHPEILYQ